MKTFLLYSKGRRTFFTRNGKFTNVICNNKPGAYYVLVKNSNIHSFKYQNPRRVVKVGSAI